MGVARIVIVDDNAADVAILRSILSTHNQIDLDVLSDGEEALRFVESYGERTEAHDVCVIVLDLNLPRYSGIEVLEAIRRQPALKGASIVVLSSLPTPAQRARIAELQSDCLQKPMELDEFEALGQKLVDLCHEGAH